MIRDRRLSIREKLSHTCDGCGKQPDYQIQYIGSTPRDAAPDLCKRCAATTVRRLIKLLWRDGVIP